MGRLPPLPGAVARVVGLLSGGMCDLDEVRGLISQDEALASAVLRVANSAAFGAPGRTFSLKDSLVRLGTSRLTQILLEQEMTPMLENAGSAYGLRRHAMWRGAIGGALAAERIARDTGFADHDLAFLCALLRDIGKLALDSFLCSTAGSIPPAQGTTGFLQQEQSAFGTDHAQLGSMLASRWGLPDQICKAIRYHHAPPSPGGEEHDTLFDIVHAADVVCLWAGLGTGCDGLAYELAPHVRETILPGHDRAERYIGELWTGISAIECARTEAKGQSA